VRKKRKTRDIPFSFPWEISTIEISIVFLGNSTIDSLDSLSKRQILEYVRAVCIRVTRSNVQIDRFDCRMSNLSKNINLPLSKSVKRCSWIRILVQCMYFNPLYSNTIDIYAVATGNTENCPLRLFLFNYVVYGVLWSLPVMILENVESVYLFLVTLSSFYSLFLFLSLLPSLLSLSPKARMVSSLFHFKYRKNATRKTGVRFAATEGTVKTDSRISFLPIAIWKLRVYRKYFHQCSITLVRSPVG